MPTLDDVYLKFGMVAEAAQLVETELGTALMFFDVAGAGLISTETLRVEAKDREAAREIVSQVERQTLGQLLKNSRRHTDAFDRLEPLLSDALNTRNRLSHHFYREHNMRKFTEAGRAVMMADLEMMHETLLDAYKALSLLSGTDLEKMAAEAEKRAAVTEGTEVDDTKVFHLPI